MLNIQFLERGGREAAGVVAHTETLLASDHPVCGAKGGFAEILLMPHEGNVLDQSL
jgi:hypothetical protein